MIIAYIRPDGAEMVEVAPGEAINAAYLKAEGLDINSVKAVVKATRAAENG